jgi:hypothetical protein
LPSSVTEPTTCGEGGTMTTSYCASWNEVGRNVTSFTSHSVFTAVGLPSAASETANSTVVPSALAPDRTTAPGTSVWPELPV